MPVLIREFGASVGYVQSTLVLFSLVTASFAPTAENLCRHFGRTKVYFVSLVIYGAGILSTALSQTMAWMAVSYILLCGVGAAALVSTPWAIADLAYGGKIDRRAAMALTFATAAGGVGAVVSGFLASWIGWRWSFAPSLIVLAAIFLFGRRLPKVPPCDRQPVDWLGGLLSLVGFGFVLLGISLAGEFGWWAPRREFSIAGVILPPFAVSIVPTLISVGVIALGFFVFRQRRRARLRQTSLMRAGLLRKPVFVLSTLVAMVHTLVATGVQFNLYQFLPVTVGLNPFQTAIAAVPYPVAVAIATVAAKVLPLRRRFTHKQVVLVGLLLVTVGTAAMYVLVRQQIRAVELLPWLIVMGIGSGIFLSAIGDLAYSATTHDEMPEGSAIFNPVQNLGSSLGRAILGSFFVLAASRRIVDGIATALDKTMSREQRSDLTFRLQEMIQTMPRPDVQAKIFQRLPEPVQAMMSSIEREAGASGLRASLLLSMAAIAICFLLAARLPKTRSSL